MMLAWEYASCHAARGTQVMIVANNVQQLRWPAQSLDLNPIDQLLDQLKTRFVRVCGHFTTVVIDALYPRVHGTLLLMQHQVDVESIETKLNT